MGVSGQISSVDLGLKKEIEKLSGQKLEACYLCGKCSAGCPVAPHMDIGPHVVMRLAQLGHRSLLKTNMIWSCLSCGTCYTRCPNEVDPGRVCSAAARVAKREGLVVNKAASALREKFVESIKNKGRIHELGLSVQMKLVNRDLFGDMDFGIPMFLQGKFPVFGHNIEGLQEYQKLFETDHSDRSENGSNDKPEKGDK